MRTARVCFEEQYRLVMECRQSGLTDYQWCLEHDIKPGTFYNWVRRLREKGYDDTLLPERLKPTAVPQKQEVIKVDFNKESDAVSCFVEYTHDNKTPPHTPIEVLINGACIRIYDGTDTELLSETIRILKEPLC